MKRALSAFLAAVLFAVLGAVPGLADGLTVEVSSAEAAPGETAVVNFVLTGNPGIAAYSADITYDDSALRLISLASGKEISGLSFFGYIPSRRVAAFSLNNTSGDGVLFRAKFRVLDGAAEGFASVSLTFTELTDIDYTNYTASVVSGGVTVLPAAAGGGEAAAPDEPGEAPAADGQDEPDEPNGPDSPENPDSPAAPDEPSDTAGQTGSAVDEYGFTDGDRVVDLDESMAFLTGGEDMDELLDSMMGDADADTSSGAAGNGGTPEDGGTAGGDSADDESAGGDSAGGENAGGADGGEAAGEDGGTAAEKGTAGDKESGKASPNGDGGSGAVIWIITAVAVVIAAAAIVYIFIMRKKKKSMAPEKETEKTGVD